MDGIVEGTIIRSATCATSQLIYAPTDQHLWAQLRARLATCASTRIKWRAIAEEVQVITPEEEARLTVKRRNSDAYEANLKGQHFWNKRTAEGR